MTILDKLVEAISTISEEKVDNIVKVYQEIQSVLHSEDLKDSLTEDQIENFAKFHEHYTDKTLVAYLINEATK